MLLVGVSGCGSSSSGNASGGTSGESSGTAGSGDDGGTGNPPSQGGTGSLNVGDVGQAGEPLPGDLTELSLKITADKKSAVVHGAPLSIALHAEYDDGSLPEHVIWSVDDTRIGSIGDDGVFEANGYTAGSVIVTAQAGSVDAAVKLTFTVDITQNVDAIADAERELLVAGGSGGAKGVGPDDAFRFLYPYDNTVFPRGLAAPVLQFAGAAATASYIKLSTPGFSYVAFANVSAPTRVLIPEPVWRGLTYSAGPASRVKVQVSELVAGAVTGPIEQSWSVAQGTLKGAIYYNTYRSLLAQKGGVMRIRPGQDAEVIQQGCTVCHTVSSQGNVLVAGVNWDKNAIDSEAFDLKPDGTTKVRRIVNDGRVFSLGALTPDGSRIVSNGIAATQPLPRGTAGPYASQLYDTKTGKLIDAPSLATQVSFAVTPTFSPDGKLLAFNNRDSSEGHLLSVLDYDGALSPPSFSGLRKAYENPNKVVAWPSFMPDSRGLVFHEGDSFDTAKYQGGALYADLRMVSLGSPQPNTLAALNGHDQNGVYYLPYGAAEEAHLDYEPSVLPVPVGGYYWVLFTSRRAYGNTVAPGGTVLRGADKWGKPQGNEVESPSPRKKIWLAPIDLDYQGKVDPSHPAIYLPGQELESGNMRAFAALEPCRTDGNGCESAAECCTGYCRQTGRNESGPVLQCVPPPANTCSNEDEPCAVASDCCNSEYLCINKRCATPHAELPPIQ